MTDPNTKQEATGCTNPMIIAAIIGGVFTIIGAIIGAYAVLMAGTSGPTAPQPTEISNSNLTSSISGTWSGTISAADNSFQTEVVFFIQPDCVLGQICGTYDTPNLGCNGDISFKGVSGGIYEFVETRSVNSAEFCNSNGIDRFSLTSDGQLSVSYLYTGFSRHTFFEWNIDKEVKWKTST